MYPVLLNLPATNTFLKTEWNEYSILQYASVDGFIEGLKVGGSPEKSEKMKNSLIKNLTNLGNTFGSKVVITRDMSMYSFSLRWVYQPNPNLDVFGGLIYFPDSGDYSIHT